MHLLLGRYLVVQQADAKLAFLKSVWPNVKDQMALVEVNYVEADGVIRKAQQNTYAPPLLTAVVTRAIPIHDTRQVKLPETNRRKTPVPFMTGL